MSDAQIPPGDPDSDRNQFLFKVWFFEIKGSGTFGVVAAAVSIVAVVLLIIAALYFGVPIGELLPSGQSP